VIPDGVKDEEAELIMCGRLTACVGCNRSGVKPGQWIAIPGAGGRLGHFAVQYAKAMARLPVYALLNTRNRKTAYDPFPPPGS
jgi:D-arabinose 1-dehydrogenase-like Zn-dependent alcohol dehydrogenase